MSKYVVAPVWTRSVLTMEQTPHPEMNPNAFSSLWKIEKILPSFQGLHIYPWGYKFR